MFFFDYCWQKVATIDGSIGSLVLVIIGLLKLSFNITQCFPQHCSNLFQISKSFLLCILISILFYFLLQLLDEGLTELTWKDIRVCDYVEEVIHSVCNDLFKMVQCIKENFSGICAIVDSWSVASIDLFALDFGLKSYRMTELNEKQRYVGSYIFTMKELPEFRTCFATKLLSPVIYCCIDIFCCKVTSRAMCFRQRLRHHLKNFY